MSKIALENKCFQELYERFLFNFCTVKYIYKALENEDIGRYKKRWNKKGASKSIGEVTVLPIAPLTTEESGERLHLERKVERAFYEAGMALMQLRDRRLYRTTHPTFEDYCRDCEASRRHRFDYVRRRFYQLIDAAKIYNNLSEKCVQFVHILPTREGQIRPMSQLNASEQVLAWETAVEEAGGKVPTGKIVKNVVQRIKDKERPPISFQVGSVCQIMAKDNPELRGKSGCWCIVSEVYEFSCLVATWDSEYTLRPEHLKSLEYFPDECKRQCCKKKR